MIDFSDLPELASALTSLVSVVRDVRASSSPKGKGLTKREMLRVLRELGRVYTAVLDSLAD